MKNGSNVIISCTIYLSECCLFISCTIYLSECCLFIPRTIYLSECCLFIPCTIYLSECYICLFIEQSIYLNAVCFIDHFTYPNVTSINSLSSPSTFVPYDLSYCITVDVRTLLIISIQ
jgi:hypothetical protein